MLFSYDRMVEWSAATGNLAQDGGARALQSLDRMTRRERTPQTLPADRPATGVPALQAFPVRLRHARHLGAHYGDRRKRGDRRQPVYSGNPHRGGVAGDVSENLAQVYMSLPDRKGDLPCVS